jgi:hypothetical protein
VNGDPLSRRYVETNNDECGEMTSAVKCMREDTPGAGHEGDDWRAVDRHGSALHLPSGFGKPWELTMDPHCNAVKSPLPKRGSLNQELVKQGWCWWYWTYASGDTVLEGL